MLSGALGHFDVTFALQERVGLLASVAANLRERFRGNHSCVHNSFVSLELYPTVDNHQMRKLCVAAYANWRRRGGGCTGVGAAARGTGGHERESRPVDAISNFQWPESLNSHKDRLFSRLVLPPHPHPHRRRRPRRRRPAVSHLQSRHAWLEHAAPPPLHEPGGGLVQGRGPARPWVAAAIARFQAGGSRSTMPWGAPFARAYARLTPCQQANVGK